MKFNIERDAFLDGLQIVSGVVDRRHNLPILGNVLFVLEGSRLTMTATDMEVELVAWMEVEGIGDGETTLPAKKILDIVKSLPRAGKISCEIADGKAGIVCGRSKFSLSTLPAQEYPTSGEFEADARLVIKQSGLKALFELTQFAMAQQDVRYYLNGMLLDLRGGELKAVTTDGHRLAIAEQEVSTEKEERRQWIVPRKGVMELGKLIGQGDETVALNMNKNGIQVELPQVRFTSKLIDGNFPDYERVVPKESQCDKEVKADKEALRQSLARVAILSNEKYRSVRLNLKENSWGVVANNPEAEEASDEVEVEYEGEDLEIGFNVAYLAEALANLPGDEAVILLSDSSSSCVIKPVGTDACRFVVMPMRL
ncbi:MAG: DNA polymerase III subunit beta [Deltaproteobacteria bacterium]|nr:DNA polymerase III subunit beta [Deltaproteobacteria bacterium]